MVGASLGVRGGDATVHAAIQGCRGYHGHSRRCKYPQGDAQGRLKIFLGMAAGVGKTVAMLRDVRRLRDEGIAVVAGFVETHGGLITEGSTLALLGESRVNVLALNLALGAR